MSINEQYNDVKTFHLAFNHPAADKPTLLPMDRATKRYSWILEEIDELIQATKNQDIYEQADAFIDVIYFALGGLTEMGIPPAELFATVQKANMGKLWEDNLPHYKPDGKVMKPEGWKDPHDEIVKIIDKYSST
jgi:predicted HAD superfamily Cof-like phosphohydrolase